MTTAEDNEAFAARMRTRRGETPVPRYDVLVQEVKRRITERFRDVNPNFVTVGNIEAAIRALPGVEGVRILTKGHDTMTVDLRVEEAPHFVPVTIDIERTGEEQTGRSK